jgi:hypothetical protein
VSCERPTSRFVTATSCPIGATRLRSSKPIARSSHEIVDKVMLPAVVQVRQHRDESKHMIARVRMEDMSRGPPVARISTLLSSIVR